MIPTGDQLAPLWIAAWLATMFHVWSEALEENPRFIYHRLPRAAQIGVSLGIFFVGVALWPAFLAGDIIQHLRNRRTGNGRERS